MPPLFWQSIQLRDYAHYPYCLASTAILCPTGQFGAVGGVCTPCPSAEGALTPNPSDAEQMQCVPPAGSRRRLLSNMQIPPVTIFAVRASSDVLKVSAAFSNARYRKSLGSTDALE